MPSLNSFSLFRFPSYRDLIAGSKSFVMTHSVSSLRRQGSIFLDSHDMDSCLRRNDTPGLPRRSYALLAMTSICCLFLISLLLTESAFAVQHLKDTAPVPAFVFILHCIKYPYLVGLALLVQWPFFKGITKYSWGRTLFPLLVTTFITSVICAVLIPFVAETFYLIQSSMYHRVSWTVNTFNPLGWFLSFLFFTTFVSFIELTVLYLCFRSRVRWSIRNFWFMYGAIVAAVGLVLAHMNFA